MDFLSPSLSLWTSILLPGGNTFILSAADAAAAAAQFAGFANFAVANWGIKNQWRILPPFTMITATTTASATTTATSITANTSILPAAAAAVTWSTYDCHRSSSLSLE